MSPVNPETLDRAWSTRARVASVNVGQPRVAVWQDEAFTTAIYKQPVEGPVRIDGVNLAGDGQADRTVHGGPNKAVYAYASEDYLWWSTELGFRVAAGTFGENLTVTGIDLRQSVIGEHWAIGSTILAIVQPRFPCFKLGIRMADMTFPARFASAGRPGAYLRIVVPGEVRRGDAVEVLSRPDHGITIGLHERAYHGEPALLPRLLDAPELTDEWRDWILERVRRTAGSSTT